jgi:hypothetical protein
MAAPQIDCRRVFSSLAIFLASEKKSSNVIIFLAALNDFFWILDFS